MLTVFFKVGKGTPKKNNDSTNFLKYTILGAYGQLPVAIPSPIQTFAFSRLCGQISSPELKLLKTAGKEW